MRDRAADILRPAGCARPPRRASPRGWPSGSARRSPGGAPTGRRSIFAADHGVAAAGVSAYPIEVTAAMLAAYRAGKSTVSAFAAVAGATVDAVDVGVGDPPATSASSPRSSPERFDECVAAGRDAVDALDADLLVLGEMGIGNTTAAAAVAAALGWAATRPTGWAAARASTTTGLARKRDAVAAAVARIAGVADPLEVLREVGGAELVAMAAAVVAARHRRPPGAARRLRRHRGRAAAAPSPRPVRSTTASWATARPSPATAGCSSASACRRCSTSGMRLGEGSGAMAAVPLVRMACAGITEVPTFGEWFG